MQCTIKPLASSLEGLYTTATATATKCASSSSSTAMPPQSSTSSKRVWERHEDALLALEEARDIDTKRLLEDPSRRAAVDGGSGGEIERKRLALESTRTSLFKMLVMMVGAAFLLTLLTILASSGENPLDALKGAAETEVVQPSASGKKLDDLKGLERVKASFTEVLNPQVAVFEGDEGAARSILMFGPPGCGKTEIAKAAANNFNYNYIEVTGGKVMGSYVGQSGQNIRRYFKMAKQNAPCILFFDEVETLLKKRGSGQGRSNEDDRTVSEFLTEMNAVFDSKDRVIVIGATNLPESLDDAAVRRFHRRLYIPIPGKAARSAILKGKMPRLTDSNLAKYTKLTHGCSGSDITTCIKQYYQDVGAKLKKAGNITQSPKKEALAIDEGLLQKHLGKCTSTVRSSSLPALRQWAAQFGGKVEEEDEQEKGEHRVLSAFDLDDDEKKMMERNLSFPTKNQATFASLSGLNYVKGTLLSAATQIVQLQNLMRQRIFNPDKNFLLFGPPGTGKSKLAEALATEAFERTQSMLGDKKYSFLSFSGADVKGSHVGESEKNLARFFRVAEANQPCIMFIDEIDTILPNRANTQINDGGASLALLGQFLQLMDGAGTDPGRQVLVLAATNFPSNIDSAALRRFKQLYVPLPSPKARADIFAQAFLKQNFDDVADTDSKNFIRRLAEATQDYSAADINRVIQSARSIEFANYQKNHVGQPLEAYDGTITAQSIVEALNHNPATTSKAVIDQFKDQPVEEEDSLGKEVDKSKAKETLKKEAEKLGNAETPKKWCRWW